jgi:uncharacterized protein YjgD (DUF1641 family)
MSLVDMLLCIKNNDINCLQEIMENDDTYLTDKLCTRLLVECLKQKRIPMLKAIMRYDFDLDAVIFNNYLETNKPFTENQLKNINFILNNHFICCLVNTD